MASKLNDQHRGQALAELERMADKLAQLSTWLGRLDEDQASIVLECAWRDLNATCHVLQRRERLHPAGWLSGGAYSEYGPQLPAGPGNGYPSS